MKCIINIFLEIKKGLTDFEIFNNNIRYWKEWCKNNDYQYILITNENWKQYVDSKYYEFIENFRFSWNKIDFIRYCAISKLGNDAIYVDLDMKPLKCPKKFFEEDYLIIGAWFNPDKQQDEICNNIIKLPKSIVNGLIDYSMNAYNEKIKMKCYDEWIIRFMLQTTGAYMYKRYFKKIKLTPNPYVKEYFENYETKTWLNDFA